MVDSLKVSLVSRKVEAKHVKPRGTFLILLLLFNFLFFWYWQFDDRFLDFFLVKIPDFIHIRHSSSFTCLLCCWDTYQISQNYIAFARSNSTTSLHFILKYCQLFVVLWWKVWLLFVLRKLFVIRICQRSKLRWILELIRIFINFRTWSRRGKVFFYLRICCCWLWITYFFILQTFFIFQILPLFRLLIIFKQVWRFAALKFSLHQMHFKIFLQSWVTIGTIRAVLIKILLLGFRQILAQNVC